MRTDRRREEQTLKPIGAAFAAVVAGLGASAGAAKAQPVQAPPRAPQMPAAQEQVHYLDPTNDPRFEEDPDLILGPSEPVEPFAERPISRAVQRDLFER